VSWDDLDDLTIDSVLGIMGVPATLSFVGESPVGRTVIFENAYELVETQDGLPISTTRPVAFVRLADCPRAPQRGDGVTVASGSFTILDVQPKGRAALLVLE
jgi:hypothetical protein